MDFLATVSETMYLWYPMRQMFGLCARIIASCSSITWPVLYSRFYEMYLRYEERLHFIQQGEIQLQCPVESNDVDDYINGSTSANGNERMRQRGRHRYMISQQHIEDLFMLGFNWRERASMTGVSVDTLRWRMQEFRMNIGQ